MNRDRMEEGIRLFLAGLGEGQGEEFDRDTRETPGRVARAWAEDLASGYHVDPAEVLRPEPAGEATGPVVIRGVDYASLCTHHLLPFRGTASIVFLPGESIVGFGQVARLVDTLSRRLQIQERLTARIADHLDRSLSPRGVLVLLEGRHLCLALRGSRKTDNRVVTQEVRGVYEGDPALRREALRLLQRGAPPSRSTNNRSNRG
jgi:GTP cyclohydrolase I